MKNFWIDYARNEAMHRFEDLVEEGMYVFPPDPDLEYAFELMATLLVQNCWPECNSVWRDTVIGECIELAWLKMRKLDPDKIKKGKMFNYFTTVMLGHMQQLIQRNHGFAPTNP